MVERCAERLGCTHQATSWFPPSYQTTALHLQYRTGTILTLHGTPASKSKLLRIRRRKVLPRFLLRKKNNYHFLSLCHAAIGCDFSFCHAATGCCNSFCHATKDMALLSVMQQRDFVLPSAMQQRMVALLSVMQQREVAFLSACI
jgi:hypothetical protein